MQLTKKLTVWFDKYFLQLTATFLLVFIPLYPKWPLADVLPGYIVRVRLEDLLIAAVVFVYLIQLWRKKVSLAKNPLTAPIFLYLAIGFISSLSAIFITKTVPLEKLHIMKLFFHWFRRVEYMSLAFIFFSAVKTKAQLTKIVATLAAVSIILTVYGFGQKYLQWPVYSTMNREFAKGWRLVLTEHARVPSTFAGHYDFAAYTVITLSLIISSLISAKSKSEKGWYLTAFLFTLSSLLLTASRTSFLAYLAALTFVVFFLSSQRGFKWGLMNWTSLMGISLLGLFFFKDLSQRFVHIIRIDEISRYLQTAVFNKDLSANRNSSFQVSEDLSLIYADTDQPPIPLTNLPPDVFENIPEVSREATLSASSASELAQLATLAGKPRTYSPAAFTFGLSSAIRFDALWPRAIAGFTKNPIFGSGYSTLVKKEVSDFTEAESTDNDYLRALGETGALGFISFYAIFVYALASAWRKRKQIRQDILYSSVVVGITGGIFGMLINAVYIDVFEASKVAYTLWALMGTLFAALELSSKYKKNEHQ